MLLFTLNYRAAADRGCLFTRDVYVRASRVVVNLKRSIAKTAQNVMRDCHL